MKVVGIIAEYDPFHNGHAWQLAKARSLGAQKIIVCLSTGATQRGALPLLPESARVRAALAYGADIVLSLPAPYAASGAEQFASAGVAILAAAGCDTLVFGAEVPDVTQLMQAAQVLLSAEYRAALSTHLAAGARNFASARQMALETLCPNTGLSDLVSQANNNLAIEYCKAIIVQKTGMVPYALPRVGANHGQTLAQCAISETTQGKGEAEKQIGSEQIAQEQFASGSALRALWQAEGITALRPYVRPIAYDLYRQAAQESTDTDWKKVDIALLARLRAKNSDAFAKVRLVSEGLEYRLAQAVRSADSAENLYDLLTTVRYPRARMRRLCFDAVFDVTDALPALPPYLHILGGKKEALGMLKTARLPVSVSLAKLAKENEACAAVVRVQADVADFGTLCRKKCAPMASSFTAKAIVL